MPPLFEGPDLALRAGSPAAYWLQHLFERIPVHPDLPLHLATAHLLKQYSASYLVPLLNICEHRPG